MLCVPVFFFKQKTAYEMRISDWSSDVCSSDLFLHIQPQPGQDSTLLAGFLHVIFAEELYDADFVTANAVGFDVLKRAVAGFTPDHVSRVVGVPKNQILLAARTFAAAKSGCVVTATGAHFPLHGDRKRTRLNSSHSCASRMPSSASKKK